MVGWQDDIVFGPTDANTATSKSGLDSLAVIYQSYSNEWAEMIVSLDGTQVCGVGDETSLPGIVTTCSQHYLSPKVSYLYNARPIVFCHVESSFSS